MIVRLDIEEKQIYGNRMGLAYHQGRACSWALYYCSSAAIAYSAVLELAIRQAVGLLIYRLRR
jgi:hypothetical protein